MTIVALLRLAPLASFVLMLELLCDWKAIDRRLHSRAST